jgi:hypothetical protein
MQARHSVISLAALARSIRRSSVVNNMSAPLPIGVGARHAWLHSGCWEALRERRRDEAEKDLERAVLGSNRIGIPESVRF